MDLNGSCILKVHLSYHSNGIFFLSEQPTGKNASVKMSKGDVQDLIFKENEIVVLDVRI